MSAQILPFTGTWEGRAKPKTDRGGAEAIALHDARLIRAAKEETDDWTARLLLALLQALDSKQLNLLEFRLLGQALNSESGLQARALVRLVTGDKDHRERVRAALEGPQEREGE